LHKLNRDKVKTKSGGGFGATVSSTRWNRYGTFATQFKAGSTGPGIVTAFMLTNPALGEEISFQITGRDPKIVLTEYYKHPTAVSSSPESRQRGGVGGIGGGWISTTVPGLHWPHLPSVLSIESITTRGRKIKDLLLHKTHNGNNDGDAAAAKNSGANIEGKSVEDLKTTSEHGSKDNDNGIRSLEESHTLKKSATENDLVYKIEWTPEKIEWSVDGQVLRTLRSKDLPQSKNNNNLQIPSQPMQIQLTIWDAGHSAGTKAWAGGVTDYGENDEREYVALVDWIDIACYDNKEAKRTQWPGKEASARLAQVEAEERQAAEEEEAIQKAKKDKEAQQVINAAEKDSSTKRWFPFGGGRNDSDESATVQPKSKKQLKQEEKQRKKTEKQKQAAQKEKEKHKQAREPGVLSRFSDRVIRILLRWNFIVLFLVATGSYLTEPANARKFHLASKEKQKLDLQQ
jgi:beta-glucanase (GH16 family)